MGHAQKHKILRLLIEADGCSSDNEPRLRSQLRAAYDRQLLPLIDRICSESSDPRQVHRIDRLEINVSAKDFDASLAGSFETLFEEQLSAAIQQAPQVDADLELFDFFIRYGSLPWWADTNDPNPLEQSLGRLIQQNPQAIRQMLEHAANPDDARRRIVLACSDAVLECLTAVLAGTVWSDGSSTGSDLGTSWVQLLQVACVSTGHSGGTLRKLFWAQALRAATAQAHPAVLDVESTAFYRLILTGAARDLNCEYSALIKALQDALERSALPIHSQVRTIIAMLAQVLYGPSQTDADYSRMEASLPEALRRLLARMEAGAVPDAALWSDLQVLLERLPDPLRSQALAALRQVRTQLVPAVSADPPASGSAADVAALVALLQQALDAADGSGVRQQTDGRDTVSTGMDGALATALRQALARMQSGAVPDAALLLDLQVLLERLPDPLRSRALAALRQVRTQLVPAVPADPPASGSAADVAALVELLQQALDAADGSGVRQQTDGRDTASTGMDGALATALRQALARMQSGAVPDAALLLDLQVLLERLPDPLRSRALAALRQVRTQLVPAVSADPPASGSAADVAALVALLQQALDAADGSGVRQQTDGRDTASTGMDGALATALRQALARMQSGAVPDAALWSDLQVLLERLPDPLRSRALAALRQVRTQLVPAVSADPPASGSAADVAALVALLQQALDAADGSGVGQQTDGRDTASTGMDGALATALRQALARMQSGAVPDAALWLDLQVLLERLPDPLRTRALAALRQVRTQLVPAVSADPPASGSAADVAALVALLQQALDAADGSGVGQQTDGRDTASTGMDGALATALRQALARMQSGAVPDAALWLDLQVLLERLPDPLRTRALAALRQVRTQLVPAVSADPPASGSAADVAALVALLQQALDAADGSGVRQQTDGRDTASTGMDGALATALRQALARMQSGAVPDAALWLDLQVLLERLPDPLRSRALKLFNRLNARPHQLHPAKKISNASASARKALMNLVRDILPKLSETSPNQSIEPTNLSFSEVDAFYIDNAGLVILWPFLSHFFQHLGLMEQNPEDHTPRFMDEAARQRAIGLLQYLAGADELPQEPQLPLNKVLCGTAVESVFDFGDVIRAAEIDECEALLSAVIQRAPILKNMSHAGLRSSFLLRQGQLSVLDERWLLRVERETHDIVLDRFPWGFNIVKLPWMETLLQVEW